MISLRSSIKFDKQGVIVLIDVDQVKKGKFLFKNKDLENELENLIKDKLFTAEYGQIFPVNLSGKICLFTGVGKKDDCSLTALRILVKKAARSSFLESAKTIEILAHNEEEQIVKSVIEGVKIGTYHWHKYIQISNKDKKSHSKQYFIIAQSNKEFEKCIKICDGTNFTRDLINDNADKINSDYLEKVIRSLIKGRKEITLEILKEKEMKSKGLGFHLAVNQGSLNEPKLIIVKYQGASKKADYTAIVGKGLTFDTGGLNLKPSGYIENMKLDMGGAAAVIGVLKNVLSLNVKKNIIFTFGIAENLTGSKSYKPGEVLIGYANKSVEVANTDAEGRLVLADAISYVNKNYKPSKIIDIATLTGACIVALGHDYTGLVTTDDEFSRQLIRSSNETDDRV